MAPNHERPGASTSLLGKAGEIRSDRPLPHQTSSLPLVVANFNSEQSQPVGSRQCFCFKTSTRSNGQLLAFFCAMVGCDIKCPSSLYTAFHDKYPTQYGYKILAHVDLFNGKKRQHRLPTVSSTWRNKQQPWRTSVFRTCQVGSVAPPTRGAVESKTQAYQTVVAAYPAIRSLAAATKQ